MNHKCHARHCEKNIPPELLMCYSHWKRIPKHIQAAVWRHYRNGQCDDKNPSQAWHHAADAAIAYIAKLEGYPVSPIEEKAYQASKEWL